MNEYENNAYFWQKVDTLFLSGSVVLTKKKGERHDTFKNLIYPVDYGKIIDLEDDISVYLGSENRNQITGLIVAADILAKELDVKVLAGCNNDETDLILHFLNQTDFQKTVLIRRGNEMPGWGVSDN